MELLYNFQNIKVRNCIVLIPGLLNCVPKDVPKPEFDKSLLKFREFFPEPTRVQVHTWDHEYNSTEHTTKWLKSNYGSNLKMQYEQYERTFDKLVEDFYVDYPNIWNRIVDSNKNNGEYRHTDWLRRHLAIYYTLSKCYFLAKNTYKNEIKDDTFFIRAKPNTSFSVGNPSRIDEQFGGRPIEVGKRSPDNTVDNTMFISTAIIDPYGIPKVNENTFGGFYNTFENFFKPYSNAVDFLIDFALPIWNKHLMQCNNHFPENSSKNRHINYPSGSVVWGEMITKKRLYILGGFIGPSNQKRYKIDRFY